MILYDIFLDKKWMKRTNLLSDGIFHNMIIWRGIFEVTESKISFTKNIIISYFISLEFRFVNHTDYNVQATFFVVDDVKMNQQNTNVLLHVFRYGNFGLLLELFGSSSSSSPI